MPKQKGVETGEKCPKCGRPLVEQIQLEDRPQVRRLLRLADKENPCKYIKPGEGEAERPEPVDDRTQVPDVRQADDPESRPFGTFLACSGRRNARRR